METTANKVTGSGDKSVAHDLYCSAVLAEVRRMRADGVYICFGNIQGRMPAYNQEILTNVLWSLSIQGEL